MSTHVSYCIGCERKVHLSFPPDETYCALVCRPCGLILRDTYEQGGCFGDERDYNYWIDFDGKIRAKITQYWEARDE
jgi:hypothetical protein